MVRDTGASLSRDKCVRTRITTGVHRVLPEAPAASVRLAARRLPPVVREFRASRPSLTRDLGWDVSRRGFGDLPPLLPPKGNTCLSKRKHFFYAKNVESSVPPFPR
jgi:hypothetical protein